MLLPRETSTWSRLSTATEGGQGEAGGEEAPTFCQHEKEHFNLLAPGQELHEIELEWDLMHSKTRPHVWICNRDEQDHLKTSIPQTSLGTET